MATIKSYTDISQSKKLAEILPLETADMFYNEEPDETYSKDIVDTKYPMVIREGQKHYLEEYGIPCWSLAALLELLPKRLEIVDNVYELSVYFYGLYYWNVNNGNLFFESKDKENFVDACYEMILKLHELNLL